MTITTTAPERATLDTPAGTIVQLRAEEVDHLAADAGALARVTGVDSLNYKGADRFLQVEWLGKGRNGQMHGRYTAGGFDVLPIQIGSRVRVVHPASPFETGEIGTVKEFAPANGDDVRVDLDNGRSLTYWLKNLELELAPVELELKYKEGDVVVITGHNYAGDYWLGKRFEVADSFYDAFLGEERLRLRNKVIDTRPDSFGSSDTPFDWYADKVRPFDPTKDFRAGDKVVMPESNASKIPAYAVIEVTKAEQYLWDYEVRTTDGIVDQVDGSEIRFATQAEASAFDVQTREETERKARLGDFKVGDKVVVTTVTTALNKHYGVLHEVRRTSQANGDIFPITIGGLDAPKEICVKANEIRRANVGEISDYDRRQELAKFSVGDRVKINATGWYGEIIEIRAGDLQWPIRVRQDEAVIGSIPLAPHEITVLPKDVRTPKYAVNDRVYWCGAHYPHNDAKKQFAGTIVEVKELSVTLGERSYYDVAFDDPNCGTLRYLESVLYPLPKDDDLPGGFKVGDDVVLVSSVGFCNSGDRAVVKGRSTNPAYPIKLGAYDGQINVTASEIKPYVEPEPEFEDFDFEAGQEIGSVDVLADLPVGTVLDLAGEPQLPWVKLVSGEFARINRFAEPGRVDEAIFDTDIIKSYIENDGSSVVILGISDRQNDLDW